MKYDELMDKANQMFDRAENEAEKHNPHSIKEWFFAYFYRLFIPLFIVILWLILGLICLENSNAKHLWVLTFLTGALNGFIKDEFGGLFARAIILMSIHVFVSDVIIPNKFIERMHLLKKILKH